MKFREIAWIWMVALGMLFAVFSGCNDSSSDSAPSVVALSTYSEDVAACSPSLGASSEGLVGAEVATTITDWTGWDSESGENTVFQDLLEEDCAYGLYEPVASADMFVGILNELRQYWQTSGTYPGLNIEVDGQSWTASVDMTVDTSVESVDIPFFGGTQEVDRLITLDGSIDDGEESEPFMCQIGFTTGDSVEAIVVWTKFTAEGGVTDELSSFYGRKNASTGIMDVWTTCYSTKATVDTTDDFYFAMKWQGSPDEGWFTVTQYKGSGSSKGDTIIMGGGSPTSKMAFLAINDAAYDVPAAGDPYYVIITNGNLTGDEAYAGAFTEGFPVQTEMTDDDMDEDDVLVYLHEEANDYSLGRLTSYPDEEADILPLADL